MGLLRSSCREKTHFHRHSDSGSLLSLTECRWKWSFFHGDIGDLFGSNPSLFEHGFCRYLWNYIASFDCSAYSYLATSYIFLYLPFFNLDFYLRFYYVYIYKYIYIEFFFRNLAFTKIIFIFSFRFCQKLSFSGWLVGRCSFPFFVGWPVSTGVLNRIAYYPWQNAFGGGHLSRRYRWPFSSLSFLERGFGQNQCNFFASSDCFCLKAIYAKHRLTCAIPYYSF